MPYTIEFEPDRSWLAIQVAPPVSEYDAIQCFREVRAHPDFRPEHGILINLLAADRQLSLREAERVGGAIKYLFPKHKIAFVRASPPPSEGLEALRVTTSAVVDVGIFATLEEATTWLQA